MRKHITLTNLFVTICITLFLIACFVDMFTIFGWLIKGPLLIGSIVTFVLAYIEDGGKFGKY